jgi:2,3-dihydroxybiphenyl 1,2-dioxygenase
MTAVAQLGYLGLEVSNIDAWRRFAGEVLGLAAGDVRADGAVTMRMDAHRHRFILHPGAADDLAYVGWELPDRAALGKAVDRLASTGVAVTEGTVDEAAARGVAALYRFRDPDGIASELYCGPALADGEFHSAKVVGGFLTGALGMGHILISAKDTDRTERFYCDALGFSLSDYVDLSFDGHDFHGVFLHANPRHHSLAFGAMPGPKRLHHFMLEVNELDDVGAAFDRAQDTGVPIARGLGRHENDRMVSFYGVTPSGFAFEIGWGARQVDDRTWQTRTYHRISEWGHRPVEAA